MTSAMYAKNNGEWLQVYPEPERGVAPVLSAAPDATQIVYSWTAATGITPASYELEFDGVIQNVGAVLTFTKTGLTTGQSYTARVRAKAADNTRGKWSNLLTTVAAIPFNAATGGTETTVTNYNGTGQTWKVHTFTGNGNFVVTKAAQPFAVVVGGAGGGGGQDSQGTPGGRGGHGQGVQNLTLTMTAQTYPVVVGGGGAGAGLDGWGQGNGGGGGASSIAGISATGGGGGKGPGDQNHPQSPDIGSPDGPRIASTVSGASVTYGGTGGPPGSRDAGHQEGYAGEAGKVVIAYRIA